MRKFALSLAVLALVAAPAFAGKYNKVVSVGDKAPDISGIPAVENGVDKSLTLSDIKEDVVVVVFLANHCPVVVGYEDRLIDFTKDYKEKGVKVVGVAVSTMEGDKIPGIKAYMSEKKEQLHLWLRREPGDWQGLWRHKHSAVLRARQGEEDSLHGCHGRQSAARR